MTVEEGSQGTCSQGGICRQNQWGEDDRGAVGERRRRENRGAKGAGCGVWEKLFF